MTINNCNNYGSIIGTQNSHLVGGNFNSIALPAVNSKITNGDYTIQNAGYGVCGNVQVETIAVENGKFTLPAVANAASYQLTFTSNWNGGKGAVTSISYILTEEERAALELNAYRFATGAGSSSTVGATPLTVGNGTLYVKDGQYLFVNSTTTSTTYAADQSITRQPSISFMAFDENGNLLAAYNYTYGN